MGKLKGYQQGLEKLINTSANQRLGEMFGVDPATLEVEEPLEPSEARHKESSENLCKAITEVGECVEEAVEELGKGVVAAMPAIPEGLATDKGIEKSVKALAKVIENALKSRPDGGISQLLERMVGLIEENQQLSAAIVELMAREESEPESKDTVFDIDRDRNGFMTQVTARTAQ